MYSNGVVLPHDGFVDLCHAVSEAHPILLVIVSSLVEFARNKIHNSASDQC